MVWGREMTQWYNGYLSMSKVSRTCGLGGGAIFLDLKKNLSAGGLANFLILSIPLALQSATVTLSIQRLAHTSY